MRPLYVPKGAAKEYGDYAVNIYTGCPHRCYYCYAPAVLRKDREEFHSHVAPRPGIVEALRKQIDREGITGRLVHLCFTCDPYPTGYDSGVTREVIQVLKDTGNHVQILTKGDGKRDFDLLDGNDWYGVTLDCMDPRRDNLRFLDLAAASARGIKTWISFEPVVRPRMVIDLLRAVPSTPASLFVDKVMIGKLNHRTLKIDWAEFGRRAESVCRELGIDYYIKESLRKEMENGEEGL